MNIDGDFKDETGSSRGISTQEDRALLVHLRKLSDLVLVSDKSAAAEKLNSTGLSTLGIVLGMGPAGEIPALTSTKDQVLVFAPNNATKKPSLDESATAQLVQVSNLLLDRISPIELSAAIASLGFRFPLSEFGPVWLSQLAADGIIDELCLTVTKRPEQSFNAETHLLALERLLPDSKLSLSSSYEVGNNIFTRWRRA